MNIRITATKGKKGIVTEVEDTTYVEAARWGKHQGWRYVLGLMIILFAWLIVGSGASVLVAFALGGQADPSVLGLVEYYLFIMVSFLFFLAGVLIAVSLVHRRHPRTLDHSAGADRLAAGRSWIRGVVRAVLADKWAGAVSVYTRILSLLTPIS